MPPKRRTARRGKKPAETTTEETETAQNESTTIEKIDDSVTKNNDENDEAQPENQEQEQEQEELQITEEKVNNNDDDEPVLLDDGKDEIEANNKNNDDMETDEKEKEKDEKKTDAAKKEYFDNLNWANGESIVKNSSDVFAKEKKLTALAVFIAANSENKNEVEIYNNENNQELYTNIKNVLNYARDYCDTCISLSTLTESKAQVYCNSVDLLAQSNKQLRLMLKLAKQRQSQKNEKFAIIPIPVQYTFKIVRTVIQYLCFGTLQIEKDISFQDFQRLVRCFEYFKLISGKSDENEVLPLLREICIQRQFTFAVTESDHQAIEAVEKKPAKLILMKQVISHVDKMHNRDYSVECASFNNKRSAAAENMWTGPRSKRHRASAIGYVDNDLMIPGKDKITSRSAKFGGQTDDNKRLLRTSMSRFAENSSYVVLGNDSNDLRSRLSSGNNNRGRNFNRARSMGPVGRRNNFSRAQSVGATHARIERRLIARKSQPRDLPGDNSNQVNPVANKPVYRPNNVYRAASRGPSRGPPNRRAQSRGPGDRARSRGPPRNSAKDSRYNDHRPSGDTHRGSRRDSRSPRRHRDSYRRRSRSPKNSIYRERRSSPGSSRRNRSRSPPKRTISNNRFNSQPRPAAQQQFGNPAPYGTKNQYQVLQNQPVQMGYYGGVPTQFVPVHVPNSQKPYGNKYGYGRR